MLKYLMIASLLVHLALLTEITPEDNEILTNNIDVPKKFNNDEPRNHSGQKKEGKKYNNHDVREEGKHKKYHGANAEKFEATEKYSKEKKHHYDKNVPKNYQDDSRRHQDKWHKHDKTYKEGKSRGENMVVAERPAVANLPTINLSSDTNVNYHVVGKAINPDSEMILIKHEKKDFYKDLKKVDLSKVPDTNETALMARYIVHNVDWAALATMTSQAGVKHSPYANIVSMSDGPVDQGSGVPFFYMTPLDLSSKDLAKENKASITVTLAQTTYCRQLSLDPEDPRCARVTLSGKVKNVKVGTHEEEFARKAMFTRHPVMETWPKDHDFHLAKLKIGQIVLLDQFGGPKYISVEEYLTAGQPTP